MSTSLLSWGVLWNFPTCLHPPTLQLFLVTNPNVSNAGPHTDKKDQNTDEKMLDLCCQVLQPQFHVLTVMDTLNMLDVFIYVTVKMWN